MIHGFQKGKRAKGQNMVEYALMLAIVVGIGWGIYDQVGLAGSIKGVFSDAGSLLEDASKAEKAAFDIKPSIAKLKSLCSSSNYNLGNGNMNAGDHNTNRGILMDTWLNDTDRDDTDIAKLTSELGATQWTYYHGEGPKYPNSISKESVGLYWSTENLSNASLTKSPDNNYSNESVLSYYYDGSSYYVMKNRVWMDQKQYNDHGQPGLASKGIEYGKPAAEIVGSKRGYSTYAEAQQAYKDAFSANPGGSVFKNQ